MSDPDPNLERDLQRLREAYRQKFRRELATLDAKLREAREAGPAPRELEAARQLAHRLKGTSGCYGLDESSAALARIQEQLERLLAAARPDRAAAWAEIEQALGQARAGVA